MKSVSRLLQKSLVKAFYQANAGFFLVVIFMGFGFLKTPQHLDIATALAYHPIYYGIVFSLWGLYALKTLRFSKQQRRSNAYWFTGYLQLLTPPRRFNHAVFVQVGLLLPVLAYSTMLAVVAMQEAQWLSLAVVVSGNGLILLFAAAKLDKTLTTTVDPGESTRLASWTNQLPKGLSMLFIHHLFNRQAVLLLGTKLFSLALVLGFIMIYEMEGTDLRIVSLGLLLSTGINSLLAFHYRQFEHGHMRLFRNLPIGMDRRFAKTLLCFLLLSLPELLILYINGVMTMPMTFLLSNALLPVALLSFYHSWCYMRAINTEQFAKVPFFSVAILFFVILGHVDVLSISAVLLIISWLIYRKFFGSFEWAHKA